MNNLLLGQIPQAGIHQNQKLLLSMAMQQAFCVLQMPIMELEQWLKNEIEQNPVLEYQNDHEEDAERKFSSPEVKEIDFEKSHYEVLNSLDGGFGDSLFNEEKESDEQTHQPSLFQHLMIQAEMALAPEELAIAELIIGSLDERGYLCSPVSSLFNKEKLRKAEVVLSVIQGFDPPGIAAPNLKASLLLQLRLKGKEESLAYQVIDHHFEELVQNRLPLLQKKLNCKSEELHRAIFQEIANLDLHPASRFNFEPVQTVIADLIISKEDESWLVEVNEESLPAFRVAPIFLDAEGNSSQENRYFKRQILAGRWLERILERRRKILQEIGNLLVKKQAPFLNGDEKAPSPLMMQELTETLKVHHSTIVRAVAGKYVQCKQGLFPLRTFFTHALPSQGDDEVSSGQVKELLRELVGKEDKGSPLSDLALSKRIQRQGISVARRTVTKYRKALRIAPAASRKHHLFHEK